MAGEPFTIRIFVADGDPSGIRLVDRLNWTGQAIVFPRTKWPAARQRKELGRTGVYILVGYKEGDEDLPTLYIGESDVIRDRIESHAQTKDFWSQAYAFVTSNEGLNKAHVRWLEHALIQRAIETKRCKLDNATSPQEPPLSEAERADSRAFLGEILQVLPVVGLRAFEAPLPVARPDTSPTQITTTPSVGIPAGDDPVVMVVPAQEEGFQAVFLGEDRWHAVRIAGGRLQQIRFIAAYRTSPISAITHIAPVKEIEPYGEYGKYQIVFSKPAQEIAPIPYGDAPSGFMQGTRYTTLNRIKSARSVRELFAASASGIGQGAV